MQKSNRLQLKHYNNALIGIETNFSTYPVKRLEQLKYKKMFYRETEDSYTHKVLQKYGFRTDRLTRPLIIANLVKLVREEVELIHDVDTLNEMLTFVRNEKGKPEAQEGAHDDLIMGLAIAHYIRGQQDAKMCATFSCENIISKGICMFFVIICVR